MNEEKRTGLGTQIQTYAQLILSCWEDEEEGKAPPDGRAKSGHRGRE